MKTFLNKRDFYTLLLFFTGAIFISLSIASCSKEKEQKIEKIEKKSVESEKKPAVIEHIPQKGKTSVFTMYGVVARSLAVEGNILWVGTSKGLLKIDMNTEDMLAHYDRDDGLANEYIFGIGIDKEGKKFLGTDGGGMTIFDGKNWKTYFPMHGLADYWIYSFAFDKDNIAWIGTWDGANRFDGENFTTYKEKDGLINIWVYGLDIDSKGTVWFGTEGGVSRFDGVSWKSWVHEDGLGAPNKDGLEASPNTGLGTKDRENHSIAPNMTKEQDDRTHARHEISPRGKVGTYNKNYVFSAKVDKYDHVWFGTWGGGVSRFDGKNWKNYTIDDGMAGNVVYSIAIDKNDVYWFGTNNGVSRFDGEKFINYTTKDGLLGNNIYAIAVDKDNNKWFAHFGGVTKLEE